MHNVNTYSMEWGGRTLTLETGKLAGLASGAVRVQYGDTVVLATATMSKKVREGLDFFPLSVEYEENLFAAGKIKGSRFIKREGRPSDQAVLNARITDRSLRPLFDYTIRNEVQVVLSVLSVDQINDPSFVALIGASAAVMISDIPWNGPIAGLTVAYVDGAYVLNPTPEQRDASQLFLLLAVRDGQIVMIEAEANEAAEDIVQGGFAFGIEQGKPVLDLIVRMQQECGKPKTTPQLAQKTPELQAAYDAVESRCHAFLSAQINSVFGIRSKAERQEKEAELKAQVSALFEDPAEQAIASAVFNEYYENAFRALILEKGIRVDGRACDELRDLYAEIDVLPRTHGSALFQRGETQVMSTVTLGAPSAAQIIDGIEPEYTKRYMHHYNFPPFSVGETKPMRGPSRRDIGHGMLAEKALEPMIPGKDVFPYTIRVVSNVLMSNGSSSQASACGSSLALMAAGVPIKRPVAGIAMGLVMTQDAAQYKVLTDIQGIEDHSGDMDFKVAGTTEGVTAIQLDIKLGGITLDICRDTLRQARAARVRILEVMQAAIATPRAQLSQYAPRIETLMIDPSRIGELIGPGGKVINGIIAETGVEIDIEDDGTVCITALTTEGMEKARALITGILKQVEVGEVFTGAVLQIVKDRNSGKEIGAIVDLGGGKDGMVHISNVCHKRIQSVSDVLKVGDMIEVKVVEIDKEKGRIGLSRKALVDEGVADMVCDLAPEARMPAGRPSYGSDRGGSRGGYQGSRSSRPTPRPMP